MTGTPNGLPRLYTAAEVAEALRRSSWWVKEQARHRRIPHCWMGGSYLFTADHVAAIVRQFEVQPVEVGRTVPPTGRSWRGDSTTSPEPAMRLVARVPRRARSARSDEAA
ncbi:MerR family transcriptional regulator [Couchioplanes caeruleus]|uniref:Helix-turn-helix domain-containing protein n=2 Tax=Couchioplanes caeruleus TaxID=56438 RepID=A0A1K0FKF8_9ACTN|nr:DNA-binding protein [Couchioplanes caeruleus]OJF13305.1 hypothetical protein BG844_15955 [Couchioplanes caeruleus subsp. caeruleus]ROP33499.1 hypothetical protein EDD30_6486 [Couchioplanes caeruleus]